MSVLEHILSPELTKAVSFGTSTADANQSRVAGGTLMTAIGTAPVVAASLGAAAALPFVVASQSTYQLLPRIPSGVRIVKAEMAWTALTAMTVDVGVFTAGTGIPVGGAFASLVLAGLTMLGNIAYPQSCIAASVLLTTAQPTWSGILGFGNAAVLATYGDRALWELAGYASDPGVDWDIGAVCTTTGTGAAGQIALQIEYVR